jgi:ribonucleoside-diphosphate reductase beta chain
MSIFSKQINFKPFNYPELAKFADAINHAYWLHSEFDFTSDISDFHVKTTDKEREALARTMLAISQIEVSVKTFWAKLPDRIQKPEIANVGYTFADSEVRHAMAYARLLELLGLNERFEGIFSIPAIIDRVDYLKKDMQKYEKSHKNKLALSFFDLCQSLFYVDFFSNQRKKIENEENRKYILSIFLFSIFIEHVSLFSQFLIIMSFEKEKGMFKGISTVVEATSKEEDIHGKFGIALFNVIRKEYPDWIDADFKQTVLKACIKAEKAERKMLDWIFEKGELEFLPKKNIVNFIRERFNTALKHVDIEPYFEVDEKISENTEWFDLKLSTTNNNDYFNKRGTNYSKFNTAINEDTIF